jgi:hypothetical protein
MLESNETKLLKEMQTLYKRHHQDKKSKKIPKSLSKLSKALLIKLPGCVFLKVIEIKENLNGFKYWHIYKIDIIAIKAFI